MYAPNEDCPEFFCDLFFNINNHDRQDLVIGGDLNLVLDVNRDCTNISHRNNQKAKAMVDNLMNELTMLDIWRLQNPDSFVYTWSKAKPKYIASRIDYFSINQGISYLCKAQIVPSICTDHSTLILTLHLDLVKRGNGYWKFNTVHLADKIFLDYMNKAILSKLALSHQLPADVMWTEIKSVIINEAMRWSKNKAMNKKAIYIKILLNMEKIKNKIDSCPNKQDQEVQFLIDKQARLSKRIIIIIIIIYFLLI